MKKLMAWMIITALLTGCGIEMAATTATVGALRPRNAQNAINNGNAAKNTTNKAVIQRAIDSYLAEKGAYPSSLEELVPDYLPVLPTKANGTSFDYDSSAGKVLDAPAR